VAQKDSEILVQISGDARGDCLIGCPHTKF